MIIQLTAEAVGRYTPAEQMAVVRESLLEAASFAVRELVPTADAEPAAREFFAWVASAGVLPRFILYGTGDSVCLRDLIDRGVVPFARPPVLFVVGRYGDGPPSHPTMIQRFLNVWGEQGHWGVCAFGPTETAVAAAALALRGHVRVGFENNMQRPDGSLLSCNAQQVERVARIAELLGRECGSHLPARLTTFAMPERALCAWVRPFRRLSIRFGP